MARYVATNVKQFLSSKVECNGSDTLSLPALCQMLEV